MSLDAISFFENNRVVRFFVDRHLEFSLRYGYDVKILGWGRKWEGYINKVSGHIVYDRFHR